MKKDVLESEKAKSIKQPLMGLIRFTVPKLARRSVATWIHLHGPSISLFCVDEVLTVGLHPFVFFFPSFKLFL